VSARARLATLHVGAMPFPTSQGTQAAVRAMVAALAKAGRETHLLTYGHGDGMPLELTVPWHRLRAWPPVRSLRSGPSFGKVALDVQLVPALRRLHRKLGRPVVIAHHVEACAAALAAGTRPLLFVAHTALGPELPAYLRWLPSAPLRWMGNAFEGRLVRGACATAAIAPALAEYLDDAHDVRAHRLTMPWPVPDPIRPGERERARADLRLRPDDAVGLYAGNLDRYQGWESLVEAVVRLQTPLPQARLLVATASDARSLWSRARAAGVAHLVRVVRFEGEAQRRAVHAAADLALVPRRTPGGLPIKLLEALARGLPTVAARRGTAGLPVGSAARVLDDHAPGAWATAWRSLCADPCAARELGARGRRYMEAHHGDHAFLDSFDAALDGLTPVIKKGECRPS
jgi:glycosyltransferase involved in cell wall biosynthesis